MGRIELSGKSQGKGRNGYFQLHSVELMNMRTDPDGQVLHVDFYPRRRVNCVGPARLLLSVEDAAKLAQVFGEAVECRPPVADIEHAQVICECGHRGAPRLEESGSSRSVSENGDAYWLACDRCGKLHSRPAEAAYRLEIRSRVAGALPRR